MKLDNILFRYAPVHRREEERGKGGLDYPSGATEIRVLGRRHVLSLFSYF